MVLEKCSIELSKIENGLENTRNNSTLGLINQLNWQEYAKGSLSFKIALLRSSRAEEDAHNLLGDGSVCVTRRASELYLQHHHHFPPLFPLTTIHHTPLEHPPPINKFFFF